MQASLVAADNETLRKPPCFGGFSDKDGYNGKPPSAGVLEAAATLRKSQRVHVEKPGVSSPGANQGPSVGVLQGGSRLVSPSDVVAAGIRPRPRPPPARCSAPSGDHGGREGAVSGGIDFVGVDVGDDDGGGVDLLAMLGIDKMAHGDGGTVGVSQAAGRETATPGGSLRLGEGGSRQRHVGEEGGDQALAGDSGVGDRGAGKRLAGALVGDAGVLRGGGQVAIGDPCHVMPIQACKAVRTIAPKFGIEDLSSVLLQPWNSRPMDPRVGALKSVPKPRARPTCQTCGHLYTSGRFHSTTYHKRGVGGRTECLVVSHERRQRTFPRRAKGRFDTCTCHLCSE